MTDLYKLEDIVKDVLINYRDTRSNDDVLIFRVYKKLNEDAVVRELFCEILLNRKQYNLPSYKSIERCRRKIYQKHPELNPKKVAELRARQEKKIIDYAIDGYNPTFMKMVDYKD